MTIPRLSSAPNEPALAPGDVLGRKYRLEEPLGEGATAVVWVAQNMALETKVAVKILREGLTGDPRLVARFRQEAKATAAIAHKNIVQVYDYGVTNHGAPYIVMELLQGETLAERLQRRGPLSPDEAVRTLMRAMKGVTVAHAKGVIHRDLKPDNIFLVQEENGTERPKVLDFGVSFVTRAGSDDRLTKNGGILGTPSYMPPEAIEGDNHGDVRGDVWALGVMLYETISGRLPFRGKTVPALLDAICKTSPPLLSELAPGVDASLQAIVDRCLAKDPQERYPGVRELYDDLNVWLGRHGLHLSSANPSMAALAATGPFDLPSNPLVDDEGPTLIGPALDSVGRLASQPEMSVEKSPSSSREMVTRASSPHEPTTSVASRPSSPGLSGSSRPPTSWVAWGGGGALVALAMGLILQARAPDPRTTAAPPPATPTTPAVSAAPLASSAAVAVSAAGSASASSSSLGSDEATLDVLALPEHALVRIDGHKVDKLPVVVRRGQTVKLRVDAPGYEPWLQEVGIEGSLKLRFAARPLAATRPGPTAHEYRNVPYLKNEFEPLAPMCGVRHTPPV